MPWSIAQDAASPGEPKTVKGLPALAEARKHGCTAERTFEQARSMGFDLRTSPEFPAFWCPQRTVAHVSAQSAEQ